MDEMWWQRGEDDGSLLSQMTEDAAEAGAAVRHYHPSSNCFVRMDEMWWQRGEDDGSLLSQMTEDAAEAGAA
ncbi:MAG: hypothetical protein J6V49_04800, partial [Bacteroidales bacterium]|nr:hypothetical protein [Bacteroidales bacterium]